MVHALLFGLVPWRPEFDSKSVRVGFLAHMVAMDQVLLRVFRFSAAIVILAIHNTHSHVYYQRNISLTIEKAVNLRKMRWSSLFCGPKWSWTNVGQINITFFLSLEISEVFDFSECEPQIIIHIISHQSAHKCRTIVHVLQGYYTV
jgi:hypothetical protein